MGYSKKVATDHSLQKYRPKNLFLELLAHVELLFCIEIDYIQLAKLNL